MECGETCSPHKRRRKVLIVTCVTLVLLIVIVVLSVWLTRRQGTDKFQQTFIGRCEQFKGDRYDCQNIWGAFARAYVGQDPCQVPPEAYDPLIAAAPFIPACNRVMFWSKTKTVVHDFTKKRDCFTNLEQSLLGSVLDGLTWCGKEGSNETYTTGCPGWIDCDNNPVRSFWNRASAAFADVACGDVTAMLNGSISSPFSSDSIFGKIEVKRLNPTKVRSLNVVLVTQKNPVTNCMNASLKDLQKELQNGIKYGCKEVTESRIQECSSNEEIPCGACW